MVVAAPLLWFAYNGLIFGDWLNFARGPYSAAAIEARTASPGSGPPHPGWHNPWMSLLFFVKCAEMDAAPEAWGNFLLTMSLLGTAWAWLAARNRAFLWTLFLWLPVPFYAYSVSFGSVPIFLPVWWPHSLYNTRYGMEMLPGFALGLAFASFLLSLPVSSSQGWSRMRSPAFWQSWCSANWSCAARRSPYVRRGHEEYCVAAHIRRGDPAGTADLWWPTSGRAGFDGDLGVSKPRGVYRDSAAADDQ